MLIGYRLPADWHPHPRSTAFLTIAPISLRGSTYLDLFLVDSGYWSTTQADADVTGNPSGERDGCYCNINVLGRSFRLTCLAV